LRAKAVEVAELLEAVELRELLEAVARDLD
jgi:hypothetical protein